MKNVLLLLLVAVCVYQYAHPRVEVQVKEVRVEVPRAANGPKLYYHSPLDAPAMPVATSTGTGYFSTDARSRFVSPLLANNTRSTGGYVTPPRPVVPAADSTNPLQSVEVLQSKLNEQP